MIDVKQVTDCSSIAAYFSKTIHSHINQELNPATSIVMSGNHLYEELLAENNSQNLVNGDIEFRRATALEPCTAVVIDLENFEAIKLKDFNL